MSTTQKCAILIYMLGLIIVISSHFLWAVVALSDKFVVEKSIRNPVAYGVLVNLFGVFALLLLPFQFEPLSGLEWIYAALSGATFTAGTIAFFSALDRGDVARVPPLVGGSTALFTALIAFLFFAKSYAPTQWFAILLLIAGIFFITAGHPRTKKSVHHITPAYIIVAALCFSFSSLFIDQLFTSAAFIPGFAFTRFFSALAALMLFLHPGLRRQIRKEIHRKRTKTERRAPFMKLLGAMANTLNALGISLIGAVTVNALAGLQYLIITPFSYALAKKLPTVYAPSTSIRARVYGGLGVLTIVAGLGLLSFFA
ncbi:MAG TPA: hypothetical protein DDW36_04105 [Candidatus Magasanikbacteria bacterium]|nr:hypothetical protein [Candidatus Magasanikbacteria bacterium]